MCNPSGRVFALIISMREEFHVDTKTGLIVLADTEVSLDPPTHVHRGMLEYFRALTYAGHVFLLEREIVHPIVLRVAVATIEGDNAGEVPSYRVAHPSGAYLLRIPSGELTISDGIAPTQDALPEEANIDAASLSAAVVHDVSGDAAPVDANADTAIVESAIAASGVAEDVEAEGNAASVEPAHVVQRMKIPAGDYAVSLRNFEKEELDAAAYLAEERAFLGESDWKYSRMVERSGLVGCLPTLIGIALIAIYRVSWVSLAAFACATLCLSLPYLLTRTERFRNIKQQRAALNARYPNLVLTLTQVPSTVGLVGGRVEI
jgi:hypothetical protein